MRLSDAGLRQRRTNLIYPDHRLPPWPTEDAPRDRSNRLLGFAIQVIGFAEFRRRNGCLMREKSTCGVVPNQLAGVGVRVHPIVDLCSRK